MGDLRSLPKLRSACFAIRVGRIKDCHACRAGDLPRSGGVIRLSESHSVWGLGYPKQLQKLWLSGGRTFFEGVANHRDVRIALIDLGIRGAGDGI